MMAENEEIIAYLKTIDWKLDKIIQADIAMIDHYRDGSLTRYRNLLADKTVLEKNHVINLKNLATRILDVQHDVEVRSVALEDLEAEHAQHDVEVRDL